MIKKSRVKYLGVAAAALLAVAPAVTTAVSPAFTGNNISIAQAADTTSGVSGEFDSTKENLIYVKAKSYNEQAKTGSVYADASLSGTATKKVTDGQFFTITGVNLKNGVVSAYQLSDSGGSSVYGWIQASDFAGFFDKKWGFVPIPGDQNTKDQVFNLSTNPTLYKTSDGSTFTVASLTLNGSGAITTFTSNTGATAAPTDLVAKDPLVEAGIDSKNSFVKPNASTTPKIYKDMHTSQDTGETLASAGQVAIGTVKDGNGNIVAYKLADGQYVKASEVTPGPVPVGSFVEDPNILDGKSQVVAKGSTAQVYSDNTTQNKVDGKTIDNKTPQKVLAYVRPTEGAKAVAIKIGDKQYVKVSDIKYYTDASSGLTTDTDVPASKSVAKTKGTDKVQVYSDPAATQAMDGNMITPGNPYKVIGIVSDADGNVVSYMLAPGQYVKAGDVNVSGDGSTTGNYTEFLENGSVNVKKDATVYSDNNFATAEDTKITKGQTINYTSVLKANDTGKILGYGFKNGDHTSYIKVADTGDTVDTNLTITVVPAGTLTVDSANKAVKVYDDAATSKDSGATLDTSYNTWTVTRTAKNADGKVVAYDLGNNQWVKAADVTEGSTASKATVSDLPTGTALYSNFIGATIYSDPDTTKSNGSLNTSYDEWSAFKVAKDSNGNPVAYELGSNQWVKAMDLQLQKNLNGTFAANAGTALYSADGTLTGTISTSGLYKVFAVTYINGHQAVKLGNDSQWIIAATGDYYPA
ncbi:hypothetical protein FC83_GL002977 [Agrilactobacillus composti DSM 18527 = JCM 14202]|uniref:Surface layer protein A domain-containing protein n=1 Tax=Agrilactobacillus composti DSM 18527 = JCM 14202 TaxID=1423734 RepID=X0PEN1_9LACO|nr:hypothetical protein [Agrilactobacillus composti]KRM36227.1 hypothetical protein FC83_GL002977 [Agrilactobacillus composti DSM 18527 = JCM 14202]GAF39963.1 hypothetical protein JCM14202_1845 [Agrilactobacillus composti DSM 18527 = JCM 14202]